MEEGGNDWSLAEAIRNRNNPKDKIYQVNSWRDTYMTMIIMYALNGRHDEF